MNLLITISKQKKLPDETLIIVNNKKLSKKSFLKLIKEFSNDIPNNINHKIILADKVGLSHARNLGIENCKTDILIFGDDDDLWDNKKIFLIHKEICENGVSLVKHKFNFLIEGKIKPGKITLRLDPNLFLIGIANYGGGGSNISGSTCIFKSLNFNENLFSCEDWDFWIRAYLSKIKILTISDPLVTFRVHDNRMTKNESKIIYFDLIVRFTYLLNLFVVISGLFFGLIKSLLKIIFLFFSKPFFMKRL